MLEEAPKSCTKANWRCDGDLFLTKKVGSVCTLPTLLFY